MGYQKIASLETDTVYALGGKDEKTGKVFPKSIEGFYLGKRSVETEIGPAVIHVFQTPKGNIGIWGKAALNSQLAQVKPGTMVMATVLGKKKISGGRSKYSFEVQQDKSNTINVGSDGEDAGNDASDSDYDGGNDYADSEDASEYEKEYSLESEASAAQQSTKQHVETLLAKGKANKN